MTRTQVSSPEGTICRQLLPIGANAIKANYKALYRWVTWHIEPITLELAEAHLMVQGYWHNACVVQVTRGPAGGWSGAVFITSFTDLPTQKMLSRPRTVPGTKDATNVRTLYYGWKQERVAPNKNIPVPLPVIDHEQYRAHLILHA